MSRSPVRHPGSADRLRAGAFPGADRCPTGFAQRHCEGSRPGIRGSSAKPGAGARLFSAGPGHFDEPVELEGRAARGRGSGGGNRSGDRGGAGQRLLRSATSRASRPAGDRDGLLAVEQRRDRRTACVGGPRSGTNGEKVRAVVEEIWMPRLEQFEPQMILVSAGFDAHREDDLGQMSLVEADYAYMTARLLELAARHCGGRLVSSLEGGYNLSALARSVVAHLRVLARL